MRRLSRAVTRTICVLACVVLLGGDFLCAGADSLEPGQTGPEGGQNPSSAPPPCETQEQLLALLAQSDGGIVTLTGDIEWSAFGGLHVNSPTKIEMGDYSIKVSDFLSLGDNLSLEGSGTSKPLVTVGAGGYLSVGKTDISSLGDGAVTLYLEPGAIFNGGADMRISALGENAVAIDCGGDAGLSGGLIEAPGPGGTGIRAAGDATIDSCVIYAGDTGIRAAGKIEAFYSVIQGGNASVLSESGAVTLDCVDASPAAADADIVTRLAIPYGWYNLARYGVCTEAGQPLNLITQLDYYLVNTDDPEDIKTMSMAVDWETGGCDVNTPGKYSVYLSALDALVEIEGFSRSEVPLYVVEPSVPWLAYPEWGWSGCEIVFASEISGAQSVELFYSEDEGKTWRDALADFNGLFTDYRVFLSGMEEEKTYWFRMVVVGGPKAGESNILKVSAALASSVEDNRDGGDRDGGLGLPPVTGSDDPAPLPGQEGGSDHSHDDSDYDDSDWEHDGDSIGEIESSEAHNHPPGQASQPDEVLPEEEPDTVPAQADIPNLPAPPEGSLHYSADEIADMISANSQRLVFISGDMRAAIPTDALAALAGKSDFAIWMERPEDARFAIRMFSGGGELLDLDGKEFEIYLAYNGSGDVVCTDETGGYVPVSLKENFAVCRLVRTGTFTLSAMVAESDKYQAVDSSRPAGDGVYSAPDKSGAAAEQEAADRGGTSPWIWMLLSSFTAVTVACAVRGLRFWRGRSGG